jgi:hypothetical protein
MTILTGIVLGTCAAALLTITPLQAARAPVVSIHLTDYAGASHRDLAEAQHALVSVFGAAGIKTIWRQDARPPTTIEPNGVSVLVLSERMVEHKCAVERIPETVLGSSAPHPVRRAWVFFDRIRDTAAQQDRPTGPMLGYVIAHEVAHMLGELGHVDRGLMERAVAPNGHLSEGLSREQAQRIRTMLLDPNALLLSRKSN